MRKLFYISFLVLLTAACQSNRQGVQSQDSTDSLKNPSVEHRQGGAVIKFDTIYFDLGSLAIDGPDETRDFIFANTGEKPLSIEKVEASCPCLVIDYPKEAIAPGSKSKITMTLKMGELSSGQFYRSALVYSNGSEEPVEIILQGIKCYE
jgi:hypothetical protein